MLYAGGLYTLALYNNRCMAWMANKDTVVRSHPLVPLDPAYEPTLAGYS